MRETGFFCFGCDLIPVSSALSNDRKRNNDSKRGSHHFNSSIVTGSKLAEIMPFWHCHDIVENHTSPQQHTMHGFDPVPFPLNIQRAAPDPSNIPAYFCCPLKPLWLYESLRHWLFWSLVVITPEPNELIIYPSPSAASILKAYCRRFTGKWIRELSLVLGSLHCDTLHVVRCGACFVSIVVVTTPRNLTLVNNEGVNSGQQWRS